MTTPRKPGPQRDPDKIAQVVCDAIFLGNEAASKRHSVSVRTVERYRAEVDANPHLADLVATKKQVADRGWADGLAGLMRAQIDFLTRAAKEANAKDPDAIHAIAGAMKIAGETGAMSQILDARIAAKAGDVRADAGQMASVGTGASAAVH